MSGSFASLQQLRTQDSNSKTKLEGSLGKGVKHSLGHLPNKFHPSSSWKTTLRKMWSLMREWMQTGKSKIVQVSGLCRVAKVIYGIKDLEAMEKPHPTATVIYARKNGLNSQYI